MTKYLCFKCQQWFEWMDMHDKQLCKNCWEHADYLKFAKIKKKRRVKDNYLEFSEAELESDR